MSDKRPLVLGAVGAAAAIAALGATQAAAQKYPEKPIRLIVPFAPGGNIDITARTISPGLGEVLFNSPEAFSQLVRAGVERWAKVVKEANIKLE
jgi:tripartite-type tricarboxylate transporter receptor subunit TctC